MLINCLIEGLRMSGSMYMPMTSQDLGYYLDEGSEMQIDSDNSGGLLSLTDHQNHHHHHQQQQQQQHLIFTERSDAEQQQVEQQHQHQQHQDEGTMGRRKRAETWGKEETRSLIRFRLELNDQFNTSKTNKNLWEEIACRMRGKGFCRTPSMCTEKWRNLLKDFKKIKRRERDGRDRGCGRRSSAKMSYYAELEEFNSGTRERNVQQNIGGTPSRANSNVQFYEKGIDHTSIPFGPCEDSGRSVLNPERGLEPNGHPLGICETEGVAANGGPTWNWEEIPNSVRSQPLGYYLDEGRDMMIDSESSATEQQQVHQQHQHQDEGRMSRRKRAETWGQEETRSLIRFRLDLDDLFNTSKTNKYLWEEISCRMRGKGFYRSPSMCTDKWRNLLKDFKKTQSRELEAHDRRSGGRRSEKMSYYAELEEFYKGTRKTNAWQNICRTPSRANSFLQFYDQGIDHTSIPVGPYEDSGRSKLNPEWGLEQNGPPFGICEAEGVAANGVPTWNWRETPGSGGENESTCNGRVISVKWGECTKRIGIDGSSESIKEAIRSAFGIRTKRTFWLENDNGAIQSLHKEMPLRNYNLHLDKGLTIKICLYNDPNNGHVCVEEQTFYNEDDFRSFLSHRGWIGLKDTTCSKYVYTIEELHPGEMFHGLRMLG